MWLDLTLVSGAVGVDGGSEPWSVFRLVLLGVVGVDGGPGTLSVFRPVLLGAVGIDGGPRLLSVFRPVLLDVELVSWSRTVECFSAGVVSC